MTNEMKTTYLNYCDESEAETEGFNIEDYRAMFKDEEAFEHVKSLSPTERINALFNNFLHQFAPTIGIEFDAVLVTHRRHQKENERCYGVAIHSTAEELWQGSMLAQATQDMAKLIASEQQNKQNATQH